MTIKYTDVKLIHESYIKYLEYLMGQLHMGNRCLEDGNYENFLKISRIETDKENFSAILMNHYSNLNVD